MTRVVKNIKHRAGLIIWNATFIVIALLLTDIVLTKFNFIQLDFYRDGNQDYGFIGPLKIINTSGGENSSRINIAVLGDSHHEHLDSNREVHQSVHLKNYLEKKGVNARLISLGTPRHSIIQELLVYEKLIRPQYDIDIVIFMCYAGNDFAEMIRKDDRPRVDFKSDGEPILTPPKWILQRPATEPINQWPRDSRLLHALNRLTDHNLVLKLVAANDALTVFNPSIRKKLQYFAALRKMRDERFGYSGAAAAEFLNQYYIYHLYPEKFALEIRKRVDYFFNVIRNEKYRERVLLFYLPSAPVVNAMTSKNNAILDDILESLGLEDVSFSALEREFYEILQDAKRSSVSKVELYDLTAPLRQAIERDAVKTDFYDSPTIHVDAKARAVIGREFGKRVVGGPITALHGTRIR